MEYFEYSSDKNYAIDPSLDKVDWVDGEAVPVESRVHLGYAADPQAYLQSGNRDVELMISIIKDNGITIPQNAQCLDFGCGGGRMLRWLPSKIMQGTFWGCDTETKAITWAQNNLNSNLRLFTNLREPHLPFDDGTFDFIYAGSVFSHINDMAEFWMLELRRIIKVDSGLLYLTFQDENSLDVIKRQQTEATRKYYNSLFNKGNMAEFLTDSYKKIVIGKYDYSSQVFYRTEWLENLLKRFFPMLNWFQWDMDGKLPQY